MSANCKDVWKFVGFIYQLSCLAQTALLKSVVLVWKKSNVPEQKIKYTLSQALCLGSKATQQRTIPLQRSP